jgi:cytoskeletal protein CcmA (bactofilin family)
VFSSDTKKAPSNFPKPPKLPARFAPQGNASACAEALPVDPPAIAGTSVIGSDLTILGEKITIISQNKLQVDGHVRGDVHGKQVIISKDGSVTGKVCAERIEVRGDVRGSIRAFTITLHDSAKVDGDIVHQTLSISQGAVLDGRVQRAKDPNELMPILDVEAFADQSREDNGGANHFGTYDDDASLGLDHPASPPLDAEAFSSQPRKDNGEANHDRIYDDDASLSLDHPASPRVNR